MWDNFIVTYLHYISFIIVIAAIFGELLFVKPTVEKSVLKKIVLADGLYGLFSIVVVATGLMRVFMYGKGDAYYFGNFFFILKFSLFIVVGLLSILPTITFMKENKKAKKSEDITTISLPKYKLIKRIIVLEFILMLSIPFWAILMANGIG